MHSRRPMVAIVGAGLMGRWHFNAARRSGARIVAVVDHDIARARSLGRPDLARPSLAEALRQPVDVVHVCTPAGAHVSLCREALDAGCNVIVEKPATPTVADALALDAAARAAGRLIVPVHQFVYQHGVQSIRARLSSLGTIRQLDVAIASAGAEQGADDPDTIAAEILPHPLSLVRNLLGCAVAELAWQVERAGAGDWRFRAVTDRGCSIAASVSLNVRPTFASLRVFGDRGSATADLFHGYATFEPGHANRRYKLFRPMTVALTTIGATAWNLGRRGLRRELAYPGLQALCAATYRATQGNAAPPFAPGELVDVARAREQLINLAQTGGGGSLPATTM